MRTTSLLAAQQPSLPFWKTLWSRLIGEQNAATLVRAPNNEEPRRRSAKPAQTTSGSNFQPAALAGAELTRLINSKPFARGRSIHLVIVEQTLRSGSAGDLRSVPVNVLSHAIVQLEELLSDQDSLVLHQLIADMSRIAMGPGSTSASSDRSSLDFFRSTLPVLETVAPVEQPTWPNLAPAVSTPTEEETLDGQDGFPNTVADPGPPPPVDRSINMPSGFLW